MIKYEEEMGVSREYRDRVFKLIFGNEKRKDLTLSLYNAVNGSNYTNPEDIIINTMENAVFMSMRNDVSFIVSGRMNIYEHQSTFNPNLPIRCLVYAGSLYSKYISDKSNGVNIYSRKKQRVPRPKLICFYNGREEHGDREVLRLSDLFFDDMEESENSQGPETLEEDRVKGASPLDEASDIDVRVTMINVNYGRNDELMESCRALHDYALLIKNMLDRSRETGDIREAASEAIEMLPDDSPIKQLLLDNKSEVLMSFLTEYDEEWTMEMFKEEYLKEGIELGRSEGMKLGREEGRELGVIESLKKMLETMTPKEVEAMGFDPGDIAKAQSLVRE